VRGRDVAVAFGGVSLVRLHYRLGRDGVDRLADTACRLQSAHVLAGRCVDQPEPRRHRTAVLEEGFVLDDRRHPIGSTTGNAEPASGSTTE
jgi:hypothetical protein